MAACLVSCEAGEGDCYRALEAHGFDSIELRGYTPFGCGDDDLFNQGFRAVNEKGTPVRGVVCCGFFKACTVRF